MHTAYVIVLLGCTAVVSALIGYRLFQMRRLPAAGRGRLINEWIWTLIPLVVLAGLLWHALKVAK